MNSQKELFDKLSLACSRKTTLLYSTSFSLAIKLLSKEYQKAIFSIYGFVRLADEIVDTFHDFDKKLLLKELRLETKNSINRGISLNPIINSFQNVVRKYDIEFDLIDSFLKSMEYDLDNKNCSNESYKTYIQGSAEAVGLMCLHVFCFKSSYKYEDLKPYAESLGSAFQKINFLRDLKDDYNLLNRVYFPDLDIENFTNEDKLKIESDIKDEFDHALKGILLLNKDARKGVFLAYRYYVELFKKIQKLDAQIILKQRVRISNFKKILILISSQFKY